jgi:hypothetical protein
MAAAGQHAGVVIAVTGGGPVPLDDGPLLGGTSAPAWMRGARL